MRLSMARSYGTSATRVEGLKRMFAHIRVLIVALMTAGTGFCPSPGRRAATKPVKMVVLGDSLSAGLGLSGLGGVPGAFAKSLGATRG